MAISGRPVMKVPRKTARIAAILACAALGLGAGPAKKPALPAAGKVNWLTQVGLTAQGAHRYGNPDAPVKLVEYVSYTCPHCAHFHKESEAVLRATVVPKGQVSVTVSNFLRNPLDLTVATLTNCGDPKRFFVRHAAFMGTQETWLAKAQGFNKEQQARWYQGELPIRMRAIASDMGFYAKMEGWGISRPQVDACFDDKAAFDRLRAQQADAEALGVQGTPSFTLNGKLMEEHDWPSVSKAITESLARQRSGNI